MRDAVVGRALFLGVAACAALTAHAVPAAQAGPISLDLLGEPTGNIRTGAYRVTPDGRHVTWAQSDGQFSEVELYVRTDSADLRLPRVNESAANLAIPRGITADGSAVFVDAHSRTLVWTRGSDAWLEIPGHGTRSVTDVSSDGASILSESLDDEGFIGGLASYWRGGVETNFAFDDWTSSYETGQAYTHRMGYDGSIVVGYIDDVFSPRMPDRRVPRAWRISEEGGLHTVPVTLEDATPINFTEGFELTAGVALDVSGDGSVAVGYSAQFGRPDDPDERDVRPLIWRGLDGPESDITVEVLMGGLLDEAYGTELLRISGDGYSMTGRSGIGEDIVMWYRERDGRIFALDDYFARAGYATGDIQSIAVTDIDHDGDTLVGVVFFADSTRQAFVLRIPGPSSVAVGLVAFAVVMPRGRRRA